jgi:hypothetical protein
MCACVRAQESNILGSRGPRKMTAIVPIVRKVCLPVYF